MISWSYALRELGRRRGRSLLSLLSVVIAVAAIVAVTSATATTRRAYEQVFKRWPAEPTWKSWPAAADDSIKASRTRSAPCRASARWCPCSIAPRSSTRGETKAKVLAVGIVRDEPESVAGFEVARRHSSRGGRRNRAGDPSGRRLGNQGGRPCPTAHLARPAPLQDQRHCRARKRRAPSPGRNAPGVARAAATGVSIRRVKSMD